MSLTGTRTVEANGIALCVQAFGDPDHPAVLLIGNSMLGWDEEFCELLALGERHVIRYDLRDTGGSTTIDPDAPTYTLRDLVSDAAALLDALDLADAHVVGFGVGGWIAQLLALDHAERVASLTLIATRPTAPGPNDKDLPDHQPDLMTKIMSGPEPDWDDREAALDTLVEAARDFSASAAFDETEAREHVSRIFDRTVSNATPGADLAARHRSDQMATAFAAMDSGDRWRERLGTVRARTLVIHGEDDPFFPIGNAEALAAEIPGAELLTLPRTGQELPRRVWDRVVTAILQQTATS